jgi:ribosomal protein S18 acetylase RimI-like enzyme
MDKNCHMGGMHMVNLVREVSADELDTCADVIRRAFGTVAEEFGLTAENVPTNGAFLKTERLVAERDKGFLQYGLSAAGSIVGFMQLEKAGDGAYYLEKLAVLPEHRHQGYGRQLLDFAKNKVRVLGGIKIGITIIEENTRLKDWYNAYGFTHTGTKKFDHLPFTVGFMEMYI